MLERICPVKPWIESAVCEDPVRRLRAPCSGTDGNIGKCPNPVHHDPVETMRVLVEPAPKSRRESVPANERRPKSVDRARNRLQECFAGFIEAQNLDGVADFEIRVNKLAHGLWWTTICRGETTDDVKYMQVGPRCPWWIWDEHVHGKPISG